MKKNTFTSTQITGILKKFDDGKSAEEIIRQHDISRTALYKWR